ncbi:hypothetical protein [Pectobacterium brasiliense]|uniref:hypothetical protein n=1 Tax=Pectobacterium brasiliense TaxID=180957 RepID=UPI0032EDB6F7
MFKILRVKNKFLSITMRLVVSCAAIILMLLLSRAPMNDEASHYIGTGTDIISLQTISVKRFNGWYYGDGCLLQVNTKPVVASPDSCNELLNDMITLLDKYYPTKPREFIIYGRNVGRCSDLTTPRCPALEDNK